MVTEEQLEHAHENPNYRHGFKDLYVDFDVTTIFYDVASAALGLNVVDPSSDTDLIKRRIHFSSPRQYMLLEALEMEARKYNVGEVLSHVGITFMGSNVDQVPLRVLVLGGTPEDFYRTAYPSVEPKIHPSWTENSLDEQTIQEAYIRAYLRRQELADNNQDFTDAIIEPPPITDRLIVAKLQSQGAQALTVRKARLIYEPVVHELLVREGL